MKKFALLSSASLLLVLLAGSVQAQVTDTYNYSGAPESWVVPAGVTSVHIEVYGAQGFTTSELGGEGGYAEGDLAVTPGETLTIVVGGQGTGSSGNEVLMGGGFNGGGNGMNNGNPPTNVGGGGGASDVRQGGTALANRVIVAGGGGGSTGNGGAFGGDGGGLTGENGGTCCGGSVAVGGSQVAGGAASGDLGQGGSAIPGSQTPWIGGGGGGYYGGGTSDAHSGGAGGSSYIGGVTAGQTTTGGRSGDGLVVISYAGSAALPTQVPTMSQWHLILLSLLVMCVGLVMVMRGKLWA